MLSITPLATLAELFPKNTVMAPRTTTQKMRWVAFDESQLDGITGTPIPILGDMPLICHRNTMTTEIRNFYELSGIHLDGNYQTYDKVDEAIALAKKLSLEGKRITYYYPPPDEISTGNGLLVSEDFYNWLNDKANMDEFSIADYQPQHSFFPADQVEAINDFLPERAIYAKICHPGVTGGGIDVHYCADQPSRGALMEWISGRPSGWSGVRLEESVDVRESWCLNLFIDPESVRYLGAAAQIFKSPGSQSGSRIDPEVQPSEATIRLAMEIGKKAGVLGYVGIAGFDIGEDVSGKPFVFDLNFRPAACTPQVLLHKSATQRVDAAISQSWRKLLSGSIVPALEKLQTFVLDGSFVPLRLYDSTDRPGDSSRIYGMLIGKNQEEINLIESRIDSTLAEFEIRSP